MVEEFNAEMVQAQGEIQSPRAAESCEKQLHRASSEGVLDQGVHRPTALRSHVHRSNGRGHTVMGQRQLRQDLLELDQATGSSFLEQADGAVEAVTGSEGVASVPLIIACVDYLKPTRAFLAGLARAFRHNTEIDAPDDLAELVEEATYFGAATMLPQRYHGFDALPLVHEGTKVQFSIPAALWSSSDMSTAPSGVTVDFGDGSGPRPVEFGATVEVSYAEPGTKAITIDADIGGDNLQCTTLLEVGEALAVPAPDATWSLGAAGGKAWVWYANGQSSLTKPVIMCEGFPGGYTYSYLYGRFNQQNLVDDIRAGGRDFIIVSFGTDALKGIFKCAETLIACIERANSEKTTTEKLIVGGGSMGGLVARCALLQMQHDSKDPDTASLVSVDSPHTGAYIPVSVQTFLRFFSRKYQDAKDRLALLSTLSAKEMLIYYAPEGSGSLTSKERLGFVTKVGDLGDYPTGIRLITVADGRGDGKVQETGGGAENRSLQWHEDFDPIVFVWLYNLPSPSATAKTISKMYNIEIDFWHVHLSHVTNTNSYDGAPGGWGTVYSDTKAALDGRCGADPVVTLSRNCFIPTVSAVGIGGNPYTVIDTSASPFDDVYVPTENHGHVDITAAMKTFLMTFM